MLVNESGISIAAFYKILFGLLRGDADSRLLQISICCGKHFRRTICDFDIGRQRAVASGGKCNRFYAVFQNTAVRFELADKRLSEQRFDIFFTVDKRFRKRLPHGFPRFGKFFRSFLFSLILTQIRFGCGIGIHSVYPFLFLRQKCIVIRFPLALSGFIRLHKFVPPRVVLHVHSFLRFCPLVACQHGNIVKLFQCIFIFRLRRIRVFRQFDFIRIVAPCIFRSDFDFGETKQLVSDILIVSLRRT